MTIRRLVRVVGKGLISVGVLVFLFVAYQLWGTGLQENRHQDDLRAQFTPQLASAPPASRPAETTPPIETPPSLPPELGVAAALIEIPRIGVEKVVVEGVGVEDLKKGPGHYPDTAMPGQRGNAAIAGHRTTYGAPFYDVDQLEPGDLIFVTTTRGRFHYEVRELAVVGPDAVSVLDPTDDDRLTLTTCHPRFSAAQRLIVVASLVTAPVDAAAGQPVPTDGDQPPVESPVRAFDAAGLSGESAAPTPAIAWGAAAAAIWLCAWLIGRRGHKWIAYALGLPFFVGALYFCYENTARLLPANA